MRLWSQERWLSAWRYAAAAHVGQTVPGTEVAYVRHVGSVAMEVMAAIAERGDVGDPDLAIACALLHDVVEDTDVSAADIRARFGAAVAAGVGALTKDPAIVETAERMRDSLARIRDQPREVWMVKLADRITNLQVPPAHWSPEKISRYRTEAIEIHAALAEACPVLGPRLQAKIDAYPPVETSRG